MKRWTRPSQSPLRLGPDHELIMALIVQQYTQGTCGIGSGPFGALGFAEVRKGSDLVELKCLHQITSTLTLFCHPIPHNPPPLLSPSPPTITMS
jgi:hypothetical protein